MSIILERLTKQYGNQRVVDHVSLEVSDGELFVLLGASGSGKSTILRLIAGLILPDSGRIVLHGRDVTHLAPQPRGTGFVFQNYSIFRHMTVAENIEFGLKIRKVARAERAKRRRSCSIWSILPAWETATPINFLEANNSASLWHERSPTSPASCCWTSRWARST